MGRRRAVTDQRLRQQLAQAAARVMAEEGVRDYRTAKQKAASRLGITDPHDLPSNEEIETALDSHQRLFGGDDQRRILRTLREEALRLMTLLAPFEPRLVGAVLRGTANGHTPIELHLFCDTPEELTLFLLEHRMPFDQRERLLRTPRQGTRRMPLVRLAGRHFEAELTLFPRNGLRQPPPCPVEQRPMRRADSKQVASLLAAD